MFKKFKNKSRFNNFIYTLITGFAIVAFWRGCWGLMDYYLFPGNELLSYIASAIIALIILYLNDFSISEISEK